MIISGIKKLNEFITENKHLYYNLQKPIISDYQFDKCYKHLNYLQEKYNYTVELEESPGILPMVSNSNNLLIRNFKMYSLNNCFNEEEFIDFYNYIIKRTNIECPILHASYKKDGIALELIYNDNGDLESITTRGDGYTGEVVTDTAKTLIQNIPHHLSSIKNCRIRGEVVILNDDFKEFFVEDKTSNPRNTVSGLIKRKHYPNMAIIPLHFYAYRIQNLDGSHSCNTQYEMFTYLESLGFIAPDHTKVENLSQCIDVFTTAKDLIDNGNTVNPDSDGIVFYLNDITLQEQLGYTSKAPRAAIAWKFNTESKVTKIIDIELQIGRTGAITPIAILNPIRINNVLISRVNLHNFNEVYRKNLNIGAYVEVTRAGSTIPKILHRVIKTEQDNIRNPYTPPKICPVCQNELIQLSISTLKCLNKNCPSKLESNLQHWVSKDCMDINNIGPNIIQQLIKYNIASTPYDLYFIKINDLLNLPKFKQKSANNIINGIKMSIRNYSLDKFIFALNIPNIGKEASKTISTEFKDIYEFKHCFLHEEKLKQLIGKVACRSLLDYLDCVKNQKLLDEYMSIFESKN